jgi:hypothetical protein
MKSEARNPKSLAQTWHASTEFNASITALLKRYWLVPTVSRQGRPKQFQNSNVLTIFCISVICHSDLSFDFAQDGEQVEPFRISKFEFRI